MAAAPIWPPVWAMSMLHWPLGCEGYLYVSALCLSQQAFDEPVFPSAWWRIAHAALCSCRAVAVASAEQDSPLTFAMQRRLIGVSTRAVSFCLQVEGAFIQGLGLFTSEEVITDSDTGRLITDGTWEYKIPAATCIPRQFNATFLKVLHLSYAASLPVLGCAGGPCKRPIQYVSPVPCIWFPGFTHLLYNLAVGSGCQAAAVSLIRNAMALQDSPNTRGVMGSKASGEPSLLLSVSVLHALRAAVKAAREEISVGATRADLQAQRGGRPPCCALARGSFSPAEYAYEHLQLKFLTRDQPPPSASPAELHELARRSARRYLMKPSKDPELSSLETLERTEEFFASAAGKHATHHAGYALGLTDALPGPCPVSDRAGARQRVRSPVADMASTPASRARKFVELPGPASVIRLREACGPFSAAKILKTAMEEAELTPQAVDGWVLMQPGDLSQLAVG